MHIQKFAPSVASAPAIRSQEAPSTATASPDQVSLQDAPPAPEHGLVYKASRALLGTVGALTAGTVGAALGGIRNAGDTIIPDKVQKVSGKVLRPALALIGAGVGIAVGLAALPLGPIAGALAGTVAGAIIGGALPGAVDGLAAAGHGAVKGTIQGVKMGYGGVTTAFDKVAAKFHHDAPPAEPTPPAPPAPPAPAGKSEGQQLELPF